MRTLILTSLLLLSSLPLSQEASACACGCGVFDIQTSSMLPNGSGGTVWAEYDFMNQNINWNGTKPAPAANNDDHSIRTHSIVVGGQYMFDRAWGVMAEVPYLQRNFNTTDSSNNPVGYWHGDVGDVKVKGVYTGFYPDMSVGVQWGLKLPTGDYSYPNFDRDTQIGTGSTDVLLGAYRLGRISRDRSWNWFINAEMDVPALTTAGYRPGMQVDATTGIYYDQLYVGDVKIIPSAQLIGEYRAHDRGPNSLPDDTGYKRALIAPSVEMSYGVNHLYASVAIPVYQDVAGNQLVAPDLFKVRLSRDF